jgi:hypothetical protein
MKYINNITLEYPFTQTDIERIYSGTSFSRPFVPPEEFSKVYTTDQPEFDRITQVVKEVDPVLENDIWKQQWTIMDLSPETIAINQQKAVENLKDMIVQKTQNRLDTFAKTRNYDGILSLCTYVSDSNPKFQQEGQYGIIIRGETWTKLYEILAEVEAGTRPVPNDYEEIEPELPQLEWPV